MAEAFLFPRQPQVGVHSEFALGTFLTCLSKLLQTNLGITDSEMPTIWSLQHILATVTFYASLCI